MGEGRALLFRLSQGTTRGHSGTCQARFNSSSAPPKQRCAPYRASAPWRLCTYLRTHVCGAPCPSAAVLSWQQGSLNLTISDLPYQGHLPPILYPPFPFHRWAVSFSTRGESWFRHTQGDLRCTPHTGLVSRTQDISPRLSISHTSSYKAQVEWQIRWHMIPLLCRSIKSMPGPLGELP